MPFTYGCKRCGYNTKYLGDFRKHCTRKVLCDPYVEDIPIEYDAWQVETRKAARHICSHCRKPHATLAQLNNHLSRCPAITTITVAPATQEPAPVPVVNQTINAAITDNSTTDNSTTNNITIHNNFILCPFGQENLDFLDHPKYGPFWEKCIESPHEGVSRLIDEIHFNKEQPSFQNICLPDADQVRCYDGRKWVPHDKEQILLQLVIKSARALNNYTMSELGQWTSDETKDAVDDMYESLQDSYEVQRELCGDVEAIIRIRQDAMGIRQKALEAAPSTEMPL